MDRPLAEGKMHAIVRRFLQAFPEEAAIANDERQKPLLRGALRIPDQDFIA
jgi:hypothetical protein